MAGEHSTTEPPMLTPDCQSSCRLSGRGFESAAYKENLVLAFKNELATKLAISMDGGKSRKK